MSENLIVSGLRFPNETIVTESICFDAETGHIVLLSGFAAVIWTNKPGAHETDQKRPEQAAENGFPAVITLRVMSPRGADTYRLS